MDSLLEKIKKTGLVFFVAFVACFILNLLIAVILHNPGGGGAEVIIVLPLGWILNLIILLSSVIILVRKINDNFMGKLTLPSLLAILLGYILFLLPFIVFSLGSQLRGYFQ